MSQWNDLQMELRIREILAEIRSHAPEHHFGRPFITPYQIAIRFRQRFPEAFETIAKPVGGKGAGQHDSLAQYIAGELSRRIRNQTIQDIEGAFLHRAHLHVLAYDAGDGEIIESSSMQAYDLSMFRLRAAE
ncbi:MAG: hypothetical protein E6Q88_03075 [Lysobacteraceae bacterium]|nr:MAG: hypothetical protein E6Q88_03075 [Xanthomonadaceae bacterium]